MTAKADSDTAREWPALAGLTRGVLFIAGGIPDAIGCLSTVSKYDISDDTWSGGYPQLQTARGNASACILKTFVYVFCGYNSCGYLNSIEVISETALVPHSQARWQLIEVPKNILIPRVVCAVAPINETDIVILGGYDSR